MIQQINNQSVRFKEKGASDIDYLKSFYRHCPKFCVNGNRIQQ